MNGITEEDKAYLRQQIAGDDTITLLLLVFIVFISLFIFFFCTLPGIIWWFGKGGKRFEKVPLVCIGLGLLWGVMVLARLLDIISN